MSTRAVKTVCFSVREISSWAISASKGCKEAYRHRPAAAGTAGPRGRPPTSSFLAAPAATVARRPWEDPRGRPWRADPHRRPQRLAETPSKWTRARWGTNSREPAVANWLESGGRRVAMMEGRSGGWGQPRGQTGGPAASAWGCGCGCHLGCELLPLYRVPDSAPPLPLRQWEAVRARQSAADCWWCGSGAPGMGACDSHSWEATGSRGSGGFSAFRQGQLPRGKLSPCALAPHPMEALEGRRRGANNVAVRSSRE